MERSFSVGAPDTGNTIKLYGVALVGHRAYKTLLFDLDRLGIPLDNVEGMTFGPRLRDGRQTLVLVSDNNFAATQFTQFLRVRDLAAAALPAFAARRPSRRASVRLRFFGRPLDFVINRAASSRSAGVSAVQPACSHT